MGVEGPCEAEAQSGDWAGTRRRRVLIEIPRLLPFPVKVRIKVKGIGRECPIRTGYAISGELPAVAWVRVRVQGSFGAKGAPQDDNVYSLAVFLFGRPSDSPMFS